MENINFGAFNSLYDLFKAFLTEASCIAFLESKRWENEVVSPYDPTSKVYHRGDGLYRCKNTGKNFNVRVGTIFEGTKLPLRKWFMAIYLISNHEKSISATQLSKDITMTLKTAWFLLHEIRRRFHVIHTEKLDGEVELDETFVGDKNKNRHANKKVKNYCCPVKIRAVIYLTQTHIVISFVQKGACLLLQCKIGSIKHQKALIWTFKQVEFMQYGIKSAQFLTLQSFTGHQ